MPKLIDLTNQKFGKLTVLARADNIDTPNGRSHVAWKCICECGTEIVVRGDCLRNGHTVSCGCQKKANLRQAGINRKSNLENKRFGKLLVLEDSGKRDGSGGIYWKCQCDCGNIIYVTTSNLTRKKQPTISCGCQKSKGEYKLIQLFIENQILFVTQKRFETCIFPDTNRQLIFDFYLPEYNILIEYDGEQHFHKVKNDRYNFDLTQKRDAYKNKWAKENNIILYRIPYTDYDILDIEYLRRIIQKNGWKEIR